MSDIKTHRGNSFTITRRNWMALILTVALTMLIAGCSGGGDDPEATTPMASPGDTSTPTVEPTPTPAPRLGEVVWTASLSADGTPGDELESFPRDADVIYAAVEASSMPTGETLAATWSIDGVAIESLTTSVAIDQATESGWVTFSLTWEGPGLWPMGTLDVTITGSSGASSTSEIVIEPI